MTAKIQRAVIRLAQFAVLGCAVCCAPFVGAIILGLAGTGGFAAGQWFIGGILIVVALYLISRRRTKNCDCPSLSVKEGKCCG